MDPDVLMEEIGKILREDRKRRGISQRNRAKDFGVSHNTLLRIESGRMPAFDTFVRISYAAELTPAILIRMAELRLEVADEES